MKTMMKMCQMLVSGVLIAQFAGCGTLMYPERKGQRDGRIDAGVAVLDGLGLLFFIIPGVIAFAVDFSNGTIYLPGTARSAVDRDDLKVARFNPRHSSAATIEAIVQQETGQRVRLNQEGMEVSRVASLEEVQKRLRLASNTKRDVT